MPSWVRYILVMLGMSILLAGIWGGLLRAGSPLPRWLMASAAFHGALLIGGFLGTLITLERAVALGRWWCYLGPVLAAAGAWTMIVEGRPQTGAVLITAASAVLILDFVAIIARQRTAFTIVMALGAAAWLIGNILWLAGWATAYLVPWWTGFLVLTIVGERLELSRFMPARRGRQGSFIAAAGLYGLGLILGLMWPGLGLLVMGLGLLALAAWLSVFDVARRTIRQGGLTRFVAAALLGGYAWLAAGGVLAIYGAILAPAMGGTNWAASVPMAGMLYDAIWHSVLLGFVFAMIFGHAPIIFPAVLGIQMRFTHLFYAHLALLHATLAMRIAGDLALWPGLRSWGVIGNAAAILLFMALTLISVRRIDSPSPLRPARSA